MNKHKLIIVYEKSTNIIPATYTDAYLTHNNDTFTIIKDDKYFTFEDCMFRYSFTDDETKITDIIKDKKEMTNLEITNEKIKEIYEGMTDLNIYKNTQYGNIGSEPLNLFAKFMDRDTPSLNGIYQRLDDKISRIKNCTDNKPRVNDVCDIIGYLNLLLVNMGVTKEDIAKFKD